MTQPSGGLDAEGRQQRHDLLNQAMLTAGILQGLVEQVRQTTKELMDALQAGGDNQS